VLSIFIPSFNHAEFIEEALDSARKINVPGRRIFIIDDASQDGSVTKIESYLDRHGWDGVDFVRKKENKGVVDSVNIFLESCKSKYVYFMASDDVACASGIEKLIFRMEEQGELKFIIGGGENFFSDGTRSKVYGEKHETFFQKSPNDMKRSLFIDCPSPILCQSSVFRVSAIRQVDGFNRSMIADDFALFTKLLMRFTVRGKNFEFTPEILCVSYRHHNQNTYRDLRKQALAAKQVLEALAPTSLKRRSVGLRLSYFLLAAIRRGELRIAVEIAILAGVQKLPWVFFGAVHHVLKKVARR